MRPILADEPFSYKCNQCCQCCHGKRILLAPYDIVRLAEQLGVSTGEVIRDHTHDGVELKHKPDSDACTFLNEKGCTVHGGRPAACRAYPLGRVEFHGEVSYVLLTPHPASKGEYGQDSSPKQYLGSQGVEPYSYWATRYAILLSRLGDVLQSAESKDAVPTDDGDDVHPFDVDAIVAQVCEARDAPMPDTVDGRMELHIQWLNGLIDQIES